MNLNVDDDEELQDEEAAVDKEEPDHEQENEQNDNKECGAATVEDEIYERAMKDAPHEDVGNRSVTEDDKTMSITPEIEDVEEEVEDTHDNDTTSINIEFVGRGYNLRPWTQVDYRNIYYHVVDGPPSNQDYDLQLLQHEVTELH